MLRKSRTGCSTCRARRVKCDEVKPVCGNCARRFINTERCEYDGARHHRRRLDAKQIPSPPGATPEAVADSPRRSLSLHPPSVQETGRQRSLELYLMHHYTAVVCHTMPNCNELSSMNMWQRIIPRVAFDVEVVLNPMLALAALHLDAHSSNDPRVSVAVSRYLDKTLVHHRQALPLFDGELTEAVWLSAVLLANLYWLLAHEARENEPYALPLQAWEMNDGVSQLYTRKRESLNRMGYGWFGYERVPRTTRIEKLPPQSQRQLLAVEEDMAALFDAFDVYQASDEEQATYNEARNYVLHLFRSYYANVSAKTLRRFVGTMTCRCRPGFRRLLVKYDPLAMALLARSLVVLRGVEDVWWMNGRGRYEVVRRTVLSLRRLVPPAQDWSMEWPCSVLDGDIPVSRPEMEPSETDDYVSWIPGMGPYNKLAYHA